MNGPGQGSGLARVITRLRTGMGELGAAAHSLSDPAQAHLPSQVSVTPSEPSLVDGGS